MYPLSTFVVVWGLSLLTAEVGLGMVPVVPQHHPNSQVQIPIMFVRDIRLHQ